MKVTYHDAEGVCSVRIGNVELACIHRVQKDFEERFIVVNRVTGLHMPNFVNFDAALEELRTQLEETDLFLEWPEDETTDGCRELNALLKAEVEIIRKHLDRHKWFQGITDEQLAAMDFAKKYGWVMKELYCLHACKKSAKCMHAMQLRQGAIEENPTGLEAK